MKSIFFLKRLRALQLTLVLGLISVASYAQCPNWNDCFTVTNDGCTSTIIIDIKGDPVFALLEIAGLNLNFGITSGVATITSASFFITGGKMESKGVSLIITNNGQNLNVNHLSSVNTLKAGLITGNQVVLTVDGTPGRCFTFGRSGINSFIENFGSSLCMVTGSCSSEQICQTGTAVGGNITAEPMTYDCQNTSGHGVQGVGVTVTSASGQSCSSTTSSAGNFGCAVCGYGPYNVCTTTICPEPCGLDNTDILILHQQILGIKYFTKESIFTGDVNNSGFVSTLDLILLNRKLLGFNDNIPTWCRFVPTVDYINAPDPNTQPHPNYSTIDNCFQVGNPNTPALFYRFMVGDVDGTCSDCIHGDGLGGVGRMVADGTCSDCIHVNDLGEVTKMSSGDTGHNVIITSPANDKITLLTFKAVIDNPSAFKGITSSLPGIGYILHGDILNVIWIDTSANHEGYRAYAGEKLIELNFSNMTQLSLVPGQSYFSGHALGSKELTYESKSKSSQSRTIQLGKKIKTDVSLASENIQINIFDVAGKLHVIHNYSIKNLDMIDLNLDLPVGLYFMQVYDGFTYQSKKIIFP